MANFKFRAAVANMLLSAVQDEYAEAIHNGKIAEIVEYQDAEAFASRAEVLFRTRQVQMTEHEMQNTKEILASLKAGIKSTQEPAAINGLLQRAIHDIQVGAGIQTLKHETTSAEYIAKIKALLGEIKQKYAGGNCTKADSLPVEAHLDNFEHIGTPLVDSGHKDLMEEIEQLMRVQLRSMINEKISFDQINSHIATILDRPVQTEKALV